VRHLIDEGLVTVGDQLANVTHPRCPRAAAAGSVRPP
jgi:hypothetical protein